MSTAETALKEILSLDSSNHWAHTQLLHLHEKKQEWGDAYDTAVALLKLESNKSKKPLAKFKYYAGMKLYKKREYHKARVVIKEALGLDPAYVDAYLAIGDSYRGEKRYEDAVNFWNKLIEVVPAQGHLAIERLQKTLFELGRFGDIQQICENILKHEPKNLTARRSLAEFYEKKGEAEAAIEIYEGMVDDHPEDITTIIELVRIYLERGDNQKIERLLRTLERKRDQADKSYRANPNEAPVTKQ